MIRKSLLTVIFAFTFQFVAAQTSPNLEQGLKPYGSYQGGNIDTVNLSNGNLMLHIPLVSYPQRGDLQMSFFIRYNDKDWAYRQTSTGQTGPVFWWYWLGGGVSIGRAQSYWENNVIYRVTNPATGDTTAAHVCTIFTADGSAHQLNAGASGSSCGNRAMDASGITATSDNDGVNFPTGLTFPMSLTDRNGNQVTLNSNGWTDTLGRTLPATTTPTDTQTLGQAPATPPVHGEGLYAGIPTTDLSSCPGTPVSARIWSLPGFGNSASASPAISNIKLCYSNFSASTAFGLQGVNDVTGTATLLSAVVLPDLTSWQFSYDNYLSLSNLQFPTGGSISYQYTTLQIGTSASRAVTARIVNANDGTGPHEWDYNYSNASGGTVVTAPPDASGSKNDTVHIFTNRYETETRNYLGSYSSGTVLKTVDTTYPTPWVEDPNDDYGPGDGIATYINVVPLSTTTTWPNGKTAKSIRQYDPGTTWTFFDGNNETTSTYSVLYGKVIQAGDYDYGQGAPGALLRQTVTNYQWQANSSYLTANLLNMPQSVTVQDSAGNRCSETDYTYDEAAYLTGSGYGTANQLVAPPGGVRGNASTVTRWLAAMNPNTNTCSPQPTSSWSTFASHTNWYDTGEPYKSIDPLNHTTTYTYSGSFAGAYVTQTTLPSTTSPNAASHIISGNYDFNTGLLISFTDQNSQTSNYTYDNMLRIATAKMPLDAATGLNPETDFFYPDVNDVERKQKIDGARWTDTFVQFDGLGRESRRRTFNDQAQNQWDQLDTCYDNLGRVNYVSYPYQGTGFNVSNPCTAPVEPGDKTAYDPLSRVHTITHSDSSAVTTNYTGAATQIIDEGNGSYSLQRISQQDALGRLTAVCEVSSATLSGSGGSPVACSQDIAGTGFLTSYSYDPLGNLVTVQQSGLTNRSFTYDSLSRLLSAFNPESGTTSYTYDNDGEVITRNRPQPNQTNSATLLTTTYGYDELHRKRSVSYANDLTNTPVSTYNYDESAGWGGVSLGNPLGHMTSEYAGPGAGVAASLLSYDTNGRVINDWQCSPRTCGTTSNELSYGYDLLGDITSATNGVGVSFGYSYNAEGKLTGMTSSYANGPATMLSNVSYGAFGISGLTLGSGLKETMSYAPRGWLQSENDGGSAATYGQGTVTFSGSDQTVPGNAASAAVTVSFSEPAPVTVQTYAGAQSNVTLTVGGGENSVCTDYIGSRCSAWAYDFGTVTIRANGCSATVNYGRSSTTSSIATALAGAFSCSTVTASPSGSSVILHSVAYSAATTYAFSTSSSTSDPSDFGYASFSVSPASGNMSGGANPTYVTYYNQGTATICINGNCNHSYAWNQNDSANSIASSLALAIHNDTTGPADAVLNAPGGATVNITARAAGTVGNSYALSASSTYDTAHFSSSAATFSYPASLSGGTNIPDVGTASITVGSTTKSYNWGAGDDAISIATNLGSQLHNDPNAAADATWSGGVVTLYARIPGAMSYTGGISHTATSNFPNSSISVSPSSGTPLPGGNNAVTPLYSYTLGFANDGNITSANDSVNGNWTYTYDQFNRLLTSNKNSGQQAFSYGYDRFGNRWTQTVTAGSGPQPSYSFTGGNNRIDGYSYDATGNLLNDGTHNYVYDAENRIACMDPVTAGACANGAAATYVYDAEGRRVRGQTNDYLYDLAGHAITLIGISNGGWNVGEVYAAGRHIATCSHSTTVFNHIDWLGTERARSNISASSVETCASLPFGDGLSCSGTDYSLRHFTGKEHDTESNLENFGARYFSSSEGRWTSADPQGFASADVLNPQSLNQNAYVLGNPLNWIDAYGFAPTKPVTIANVWVTYWQQKGETHDLAGLLGVGASGLVMTGSPSSEPAGPYPNSGIRKNYDSPDQYINGNNGFWCPMLCTSEYWPRSGNYRISVSFDTQEVAHGQPVTTASISFQQAPGTGGISSDNPRRYFSDANPPATSFNAPTIDYTALRGFTDDQLKAIDTTLSSTAGSNELLYELQVGVAFEEKRRGLVQGQPGLTDANDPSPIRQPNRR